MPFLAIKQWNDRSSTDELADEILQAVQAHASGGAFRCPPSWYQELAIGERSNGVRVCVKVGRNYLRVLVLRVTELGSLHPQVDFEIVYAVVHTLTVTRERVPLPFDYEPCDAVDFLRYVETAAAAVPGLLPDDQKLFNLPLYTFK